MTVDDQEAARLGLPGLSPPPADLPNAWLHDLERRAAALAGAREDTEYALLQGQDAVPAAVHQGLARRWLLTDALEAACAARLPHETGLRRRWLEVLRDEAESLRLACDPEVTALTATIERAVWAFQPAATAPDADAREVARARAAAGLPLAAELREPLLALVRRRNQLARAAGDADFYHTRCRLQGMPVAWHGPLLDDLEPAAARAMRRVVDALAAETGDRPQEAWQVRGALRASGAIPAERLPAVDAAALALVDARLGLEPLGGLLKLAVGPFAAGGMCSVADPAADVRVLVADWLVGSGPQNVLLHEYGHARHAVGMARTGLPHHLAWMMKGAPAAACEALAILFETITEEPGWIAEVTGATPAELAGWVAHARRRRAVGTAVELFEARFEAALYADPQGDIEGLRRELGARILGLELDLEARLWPTSPILPSFPAHNTAYVLAGMAAAQLRAARGGALWGDRGVGPWLASAFDRPAGTRPWPEVFAAAAGAPLGAAALAGELAG